MYGDHHQVIPLAGMVGYIMKQNFIIADVNTNDLSMNTVSSSSGICMANSKQQQRSTSITSPIQPDPSSMITPLLKMGFSPRECEAAVNAIRNLSSTSSNSDNDII